MFILMGEKSKALDNLNKAINIDPKNDLNFFLGQNFSKEEEEYEKGVS